MAKPMEIYQEGGALSREFMNVLFLDSNMDSCFGHGFEFVPISVLLSQAHRCRGSKVWR